ncbi:FAD-binding oxidoreductase [Paenisporosarcina sp. TG20]|uniref:FAD-binding oxidoreductase n=1 Tax=Paenisporosarcina sp. TG20 TaxID=1211706 RepID=UPI00031F6821|nr:FAD-linked oxidase C-terminal domain-containing protein [Paenisporosarcina sp. TG20]
MLVKELIASIGSNKVSQTESDLYNFSKDESSHTPVEPDVVVFPESQEDILEVLKIARKFHTSVVPYGAGSGLEGQVIPIQKGISMSFERMNQVVEFQHEDMLITVQAGMTRLQLNEFVNRHGLYFPIDPGADATIGGMTATNASGTTAVKFGSMRDQLLDLKVIMADGKVIHTGSKAKKSSSGYHLTGLFAGSEGTLGIITEITLRLHGIPEHTIAARCTFKTIEECASAAQTILMSGTPVLRMELVDANSIKQVNEYGGYSYPEEASLFFEFSGSRLSATEDAETTKLVCTELGCQNFVTAIGSNERALLWKARHEMAYAYRHMKGMSSTGADVCVPISKLPQMVEYARKLLDESGLHGGTFGHVGDGNFHTIVMYDPTKTHEKQKADHTNDQLALLAISLGGTCTGEHGVGLGKKKFQLQEHGEALMVMKQMKNLLDPMNILNPGKIFP